MRIAVVSAAVEATTKQRYVPYAVCVTCRKHVYPEQHKIDGHDVAHLTREEQDEVWRQHDATNKAEQARTNAFRRI